MKIMNAAQIQEDNYFRHIIHNDIDKIIMDIKEDHKDDTVTAEDSNVILELKKSFEFMNNDAEITVKKQLEFLCFQLGLNVSKLSEIELTVFLKVLMESKHMITKNRGKWKRLK